jgi:hypothetical protein
MRDAPNDVDSVTPITYRAARLPRHTRRSWLLTATISHDAVPTRLTISK